MKSNFLYLLLLPILIIVKDFDCQRHLCQGTTKSNCSLFCDSRSEFQLLPIHEYIQDTNCTTNSTVYSITLQRFQARVIPDGWLDQHSGLHTLRFSYTDLVRIPERLFLRNNCTIEVVEFVSNFFLLLSNDSFAGLNCSLLSLTISSSNINEFTVWSIRYLYRLKSLDMRYNSLTYLPKGLFTRLTHLEKLLLTRNSLHLLDSRDWFPFNGLQFSLTDLLVHFTNLKTFSQRAFRPLTRLNHFGISGNQLLACDCGLKWILDTNFRLLIRRGNFTCFEQIVNCKETSLSTTPYVVPQFSNDIRQTTNPMMNTFGNNRGLTNMQDEEGISGFFTKDTSLAIGLTGIVLFVISMILIIAFLIIRKNKCLKRKEDRSKSLEEPDNLRTICNKNRDDNKLNEGKDETKLETTKGAIYQNILFGKRNVLNKMPEAFSYTNTDTSEMNYDEVNVYQ